MGAAGGRGEGGGRGRRGRGASSPPISPVNVLSSWLDEGMGGGDSDSRRSRDDGRRGRGGGEEKKGKRSEEGKPARLSLPKRSKSPRVSMPHSPAYLHSKSTSVVGSKG